jgi:glycerol-3-phosphate dehydrogenase
VVLPSAAGDGRHVFVLPWAGRTFAGTTDTGYVGDLDDPPVTDADRDYLLGAVRAAFPSVVDGDVVASWAGLRPLCDTSETGPTGEATADLSRRHVLDTSVPGLLTVAGGKLTTYRAMAEQVVDRLAPSLGNAARCRTRRIPLGLTGRLAATVERAGTAAARAGLPPDVGRRLVLRYGDDWMEALRLIRADPALAEPVADGAPVLAVELALAGAREMALTEQDVLVRRTRLATLVGASAVTAVAARAGLPGSASTVDPPQP